MRTAKITADANGMLSATLDRGDRASPTPCNFDISTGTSAIVDQFSMPVWDKLVGIFDDALYDHTAFLGAATWGRSRLSHIAATRNGDVVGAAQLFVFRPPPLRSGPGIAYAKFAPLWQRKNRPPDIADLRCTLEAMVQAYAVDMGLCLTIVPQADPDACDVVRDELDRLGFRHRRNVESDRRYLVDCTLAEEDQRASLGQKWRYNLKRALKADLSIGVVEGQEGVDAFMRLHDSMRKRKNYSDQTWVDRYRSLVAETPTEMHPAVVIATHEGTPTAGAVVGRLGRTAIYLFGGTDDRALALKAGYALQWWITCWLSRQGVRWYDLDGDSGSPGLHQFKSGLAGKAGQVAELPGEFDYCVSKASRLAATGIQSLRAARNVVRNAADKARAFSLT